MTVVFKAIPLAATIFITACTVGPDYHKPDIQLTAHYQEASALSSSNDTLSMAWWRSFGDSDLDRIIDRVSTQNLDLAQARARVAQAQAVARRAGAARLPQLDASGSASRQHTSVESPLGKLVDEVGGARNYDDYAVGAGASWEVDLFGGLRRAQEAANAESQAVEVSNDALQLAVKSEAADAYLTLRGLQARLLLAQSQTKTQDQLVDLIEKRFAEGLSADRERQRAIGERERVRATIPPLVAQIDAQFNRLDVLMGAQPGTYRTEFERYISQPTAPTLAGSAAPGDLLRHRPDVVAAERRVAAANARIGAALSGYYPGVSLGGSVGVDATSTGSLFSSDALLSQALVGLHWRLFDFGRVDAEVAQARGREAELLAAYRGTVLKASEDVENSLSRWVQLRIERSTLENQIAALTIARDQTEKAYRDGALALIDVLDAERELLTASDRLAAARAESARAAVASYRALGGGWPG